MTVRMTRFKVVRVVLATTFLVALVAGATALLADTRPLKAKAESWAAREAALGRLPVTLDELSAMPMVYRRASFLQMTPEQRSAIWQDQFARFAARPELSTEQRDVVLKYRSLLTPELYDLFHPERERLVAETSALCPLMQSLFDVDQRWALKNLGPRPTVETESRLVAFARFVRSAFGEVPVNADAADCRCNSGLGSCDCDGGEVCKVLECTETVLECGCGGGAVNCNRLCDLPVIN
jgi:hypothetical protein